MNQISARGDVESFAIVADADVFAGDVFVAFEGGEVLLDDSVHAEEAAGGDDGEVRGVQDQFHVEDAAEAVDAAGLREGVDVPDCNEAVLVGTGSDGGVPVRVERLYARYLI